MIEKRHAGWTASHTLRRELNDDQRITLSEIEGFGWELKFVRRPMFMDPVAVVFDCDRRHFGVIEPDGKLNEHPALQIRV